MERHEAELLLARATEEHDNAKTAVEAARLRLYEVVRLVSPVLRQVDIVRSTGYTREHVYTIIHGKRGAE